MIKKVPEAVKDIFHGAARKQGREMSPGEIGCITHAYKINGFFAQISDLEAFMKKPMEIGLQYPMRHLYVLIQMDVEVSPIYPTRIKLWDHYHVLLKEYTTNKVSKRDKVKSGFGKLIYMELKTNSDDTKWDELQDNKRKASRADNNQN